MIDRPPQAGGELWARQLLNGAATGGKDVARQVDAIELSVIVGAILQMVQHLKCRAQRVRRRERRPILAMKIEKLATDGRGGIAAIFHQIVPIAVAQLRRIEPEGTQ